MSAAEASTALGQRVVVLPTFDDGPLNRDVWRSARMACPDEDDFLGPLRRILAGLEERQTKAIFYATGWANIDLDASCPSRNEEALRGFFRQGLREITAQGHIVGVHAFNHEQYQADDLSAIDIEADLQRTLSEIKGAKVPYARVWRTPYGSHPVTQKQIASKLNLTTRLWHLNSADSAIHDDFPLRGLFANKYVWLSFSFFSLAIWSALLEPTVEGQEPFRDILLHINSRSAEFLSLVLDRAQYYLENNLNADFGEHGTHYWAENLQTREVLSYIGQNKQVGTPTLMPASTQPGPLSLPAL